MHGPLRLSYEPLRLSACLIPELGRMSLSLD